MYKVKLTIPGILVIDTPGHEAFYNLRVRGGAAADFAILVVDIMEGFQAQTWECIDILKERRVPFLVAANKIDRIPGWRPGPTQYFTESIKLQDPAVRRYLDEKIYQIVGSLSAVGFSAERFDRVTDFSKTVAIVPTSAKTGEGIPELLLVLAGLTQRYMKKQLEFKEGPAKGVILEVKEELGLGLTVNAIIYDGVLRKDDIIVIGGIEGPIVTKLRAILLPKPLDEIRDPREKFTPVDEVVAAAGVKLVAPNLEGAVAGSPMRAVWDESELQSVVDEIEKEVKKIIISTDKVGVVLKADTLGSLEALVNYLRRHDVPIRLAGIGDVSKRDVMEAVVVMEKDPYRAAILAFNVKILPDAEEEAKKYDIPIFWSNIIYKLLEDYDNWVTKKREEEKKLTLEKIIMPAKIMILPGYVFRRSKPAIVGVKVLVGRIRPRYPLMTSSGKYIGQIMQIQQAGQSLREATAGMEVAISIREAIVGRHIKEGDIIYVDVPEPHIRTLKLKFSEELSSEELELLNEIMKIKRSSRK